MTRKAYLPLVVKYDLPIVYWAEGEFHDAYRAMRKEKHTIASAEEIVEAYITLNSPGSLIHSSIWIGECDVLLPHGDVLLVSRRYNPILRASKKATRDNFKMREFGLSDEKTLELIAHSSQDPEEARKTGILYIRKRNLQTEIDLDELDKSAFGRFLFGKQTKPYAHFLKEKDHTKLLFKTDATFKKKTQMPCACGLLLGPSYSNVISDQVTLSLDVGHIFGFESNRI